ncbi:MAG: GNAT family N-acyltransferase [Actinomycetota bacterium]
MTITVRRATTAADLRAAFALRRDVFIGEGIVRGTTDDLFFDVFDTVAESTVFVAVHDGRVIGTVRTTVDSELGFPSDDYFDFRSWLPQGGRTSVGASMLCVAMGRRRSSAAYQLVAQVYAETVRVGATHVFAAMRPHAVRLVIATGGYAVAEEFMHPVEQVPVVPMIADVAGSESAFLDRIRARHAVPDRPTEPGTVIDGAVITRSTT